MHVSFVADVSMSLHMQHQIRMIGIGLASKLVWKQHSLATGETRDHTLTLYQSLNLITVWHLNPQLQPAADV